MGYEGLIAETITMTRPQGRRDRGVLPRGRSGARSCRVWWSFTTCPAGTSGPRKSRASSRTTATRRLRRTCFRGFGPGRWDDVAAAARAAGGMPDAQVVGDVGAAAQSAADQPYCQRQSRRHRLLLGRAAGVHAGVQAPGHRRGRRLLGRAGDRQAGGATPQRPVAPYRHDAGRCACPLLGIFGNDDASPDAEQVNRTEAVLKRLGKDYEFHRYDGAGHGFFATDRPGYRPEQAVDGWKKVFAFFERTLQAHASAREPAIRGGRLALSVPDGRVGAEGSRDLAGATSTVRASLAEQAEIPRSLG